MEKFELIKDFFLIEDSENFGRDVFTLLNKIIPFESGYIFYTNTLQYSHNPKAASLNKIKKPYLKEDLKFRKTKFGEIIITGKNFNENDKKLFKICACTIANITKDIEISKIVKMQIEALQEGYIEIRESNKKLEQAEKIKTKFLSHVSHELRTPLNSILGFSEMLENGIAGKLNEKQTEYISDIKVSGIKLLEMINEILDMSKIEAGAMKLNLKKFETSQVSDEVINIIKPLILKKKLKFVNKTHNFEIIADYQKIQQILFNLLSNAIKYTSKNITLEIKKNKCDFQITVEDDGIGISKENQSKIFEKFEQISQGQSSSTGLGLTITRELVKLHNGKIKVKSSEEKGAKFIVTIPNNMI